MVRGTWVIIKIVIINKQEGVCEWRKPLLSVTHRLLLAY